MASKKKGAPPPPEPEPVVVHKERVRVGPVPPEVIEEARKSLKTEQFDVRYCDEPSKGGSRRRRLARHQPFDPRFLNELRVQDLFDYDYCGWTPIHYSAFCGYYETVDAMLTEIPLLKNLPTSDDMESSPLLLAVMANNLRMVKKLMGYNADYKYVDWYYHGVVELCAFKQHLAILRYFIGLGLEELPVWNRLMAMAASEPETDVLAAAVTLKMMLERPSEHTTNANWRPAYDNGFAETITKLVGSERNEAAKVEAIRALLNVVDKMEMKAGVVNAGMIETTVRILTTCDNSTLLETIADLLKALCDVPEYAHRAIEAGVMAALTKAMQNTTDKNSLAAIVMAINRLVSIGAVFQDSCRDTPGAVQTMIGLYKNCSSRRLLQILTDTIATAARGNAKSQKSFVENGVAPWLTALTVIPIKSLLLSSLEAFRALAEDNPETQRLLLVTGIVDFVLNILKKTRSMALQERTASVLWALVGENVEERLMMAEQITMLILNEFIESNSPLLNLVAVEGFQSLVYGPLGQHDAMREGGCLPRVISLIQRPLPEQSPLIIAGYTIRSEAILLAGIRTIRGCCIRAGFVKCVPNQALVCEEVYGCLPTLVGFLVDTGNHATLKAVLKTPEFNINILIEILNDESVDTTCRLIAGMGLAAFSYNCVDNQIRITKAGAASERGLTFRAYQKLMATKNEEHKTHAALQVILLCRCFPDNNPAWSACHGIKTLASVMHSAKSNAIKVLAANYIAVLSHTRPGLPDAFISIETVQSLTAQLTNIAEHVRGYAAITLGYMSFNPIAKRQILNACRVDQLAYKVLKHYTRENKLAPEFLEDWQHYVFIGLPPIGKNRPRLVRRSPIQTFDEARPVMLSGLDDHGLEPDAEESTGDYVEFPPTDAKNPSDKYRKKVPKKDENAGQSTLPAVASNVSMLSMKSAASHQPVNLPAVKAVA